MEEYTSGGNYLMSKADARGNTVTQAAEPLGSALSGRRDPETRPGGTNKAAHAGVFQGTGEMDNVVPKDSDGTARYSKMPAIEDVMDYWAGANEFDAESEEPAGKSSLLTKRFSASSDRQVWQMCIREGRCSWPDGRVTGIDINGWIPEFFGERFPQGASRQAVHRGKQYGQGEHRPARLRDPERIIRRLRGPLQRR